MSDALGPVAVEDTGGMLPQQGVPSGKQEYSEEVSKQIDAAISQIIDEGLERATQVITEHRGALDAIAKELIKVETLEREDFEKLLIANGITPKKEESDDSTSKNNSINNNDQ